MFKKMFPLVRRKFWILSWLIFAEVSEVGWDCLVLFFQFVSCLVRDNLLSTFEFNTVCFVSFSTWNFWLMDFMDWDSCFVFNPKNLRLKFCVGSLWWYCVEFDFCRSQLLRWFNGGSRLCCSSSLISSESQVC